MSAETLIVNLTKQYQLHESLLRNALKKTEVLKKGDVDSLQEIMREEQKLAAAITMMENERQTAAQSFLKKSADSQITIVDCIKAAVPEAAETLKALQDQLVSVIAKLQEQNELNQQLIYQTLQFVNINLDVLQPEKEAAAYSRPDVKKQHAKPGKSFFDSKA
ncbi:flagellar protein FlgN [Bacillus norwichensis]|uniref:Flagellar protein FlgN n=1 Tax=Bacillus norwichensis TaxID=2762217 RepID=A0ABR8VIT4_9BACI|nr:flagellar protein FlgN [Bacillus norwichensis]MBD8004673.1 flagellar protein FlgN [Bacillus norwichensis]